MSLVRYEDERDRARAWVALMAPAAELARSIAETDFVPRALRNSPAAIAAAILYGDEVGLGPLQSLSKIAVIDGKPYIAAEAQRALVLARGHELWLEEASNVKVIWCGQRAGSEKVTRVAWTMDDARRAHLDGRPNWRSYPRAMLSARASAELCRAVFADVIGGLAAIEEYEDAFPSSDVGTAADSPPATRKRRRTRTAEAVTDNAASNPAAAVPPRLEVVAPARSATTDTPAPLPDLPPLPGEPLHTTHNLEPGQGMTDKSGQGVTDSEPMTDGQRRRMMALYRARGITDRKVRLQLAAEWVGRPLSSSKDLTSTEADRVVAVLESLPEPESEPEPEDTPPL
jgi:hypothetical protein